MSLIIRVTSVVLMFVYGVLVIMATLMRILRHGRKFFQIQKRDKPPACLQDPQLGRHAYIQLKEVKLHYVANGDSSKPLLLLLHGFPDFWYIWRYQLKEFASNYWVVAVDLRGYGESSKPKGVDSYAIPKIVGDITELIPALGKQKAIVGGHDWGGAVAWHLTGMHPELVERLIIFNAPHPKNFMKVLLTSWKQFFSSWYMLFFQLPYLPELVLAGNDLEYIRLPLTSDGKKTPESDVEAYKYTYSQPGAITPPLNYYRAAMRGTVRGSTTSPRITVPTLVIWGENDRYLTLPLATGCKKYVDNITVHTIKGATHWVVTDKPDIVNQHISQFLRETS